MIATKLVTAHAKGMTNAQEKLLSQSTLSEMRPEKIGARLRLIREALNLKPAEMADSLGIERTYWSRFENGRRAVTETMAAILAERYGVTLDFIILGRWSGLPLDLASRMRAIEAQYRSSSDSPDEAA